MDYWKECMSEAFEDAGLAATKEQLEIVTAWVEGAHENYGMATGEECIPNPVEVQAEAELRDMKRKIDKQEEWENSTQPCRDCTTTGFVKDGWSRPVLCLRCDGKGRHK